MMLRKSLVALFLTFAVLSATAQRDAQVARPTTAINLESLLTAIDYNMDISGLSLSDLRVLRNAPAARKGYPFKDAYLRGVYGTTTWYDSLTWVFDEALDFQKVEQRDGETWRDYYYRSADETKALKYSTEELAFMKRLKQREDELRKQNFAVGNGQLVNINNLLNPTQLANFDPTLSRQLTDNGFAIVPARHRQLFHVYEQNDYSNFPSFVTTDLYLQLFHLYFDCMLREVEEHTLDSLLTDLTHDMFINLHGLSKKGYTKPLRDRAWWCTVYFAVAYQLLTGNAIGHPDTRAAAQLEVDKVMRAENDTSSFIGEYREVQFSYSLFRPRGHYTRSERLQRYFRAMMWLQSVPFGLDSADMLQAAVVIADELNQHAPVRRTYERINSLLTLLMGKPDNLSITQLQGELRASGFTAQTLLGNKKQLKKLQRRLNAIGDSQTRLRPKFLRTSRNKICFMPQRYQPDAEVLQEMVDYETTPTQRPVPQGLDVMAAMGAATAERLLSEQPQQWQGYKPAMARMKQRMQQVDFDESIATGWLATLQALTDSARSGKPYFMATSAWDRKNLNAALASWAELKHDAILYAKQPMGAECGGGGIPDPVVKGYVEPNTAFWLTAENLLKATAGVLTKEKALSDKISRATERMQEALQLLLNISRKELKGIIPTDEEMDQLKCMGATVENISLDLIRESDQWLMGWDDVQGTDRKVALVADVYTANADNNPAKSILYAAVGDADEIYVVVEMGGYLYLTRGAVLSYREFSQPIGLPRLTDEEWQQQLNDNPRKGVPQWMEPITVPLKEKLVPNEEVFYSSGC